MLFVSVCSDSVLRAPQYRYGHVQQLHVAINMVSESLRPIKLLVDISTARKSGNIS